MHQRLADLSDTFPFVLAEDRSEDPSRVAGELEAMVLGRVLEILTRFSISLSGETPTPVVLDRVSRAVLTALAITVRGIRVVFALRLHRRKRLDTWVGRWPDS